MINIFVYAENKRLLMSTVYDVKEAVKMIHHYVRKFSRCSRTNIDGSFSIYDNGHLTHYYYEKESGWKYF